MASASQLVWRSQLAAQWLGLEHVAGCVS
ncbi:hypothetical protein PG985_010747 [Apiospora marii]|uniref:Uncharacterized protein n=1 Tax=Apiospora marii TaxID=335849 RepID=A0ABR1T3R7_9PEZI